MNTILDEITSLCPPYYDVQWTLKMKGTAPVLSLESEESIEKINELFNSFNTLLDDKISITKGKDRKAPFWPTIILQNVTMEKLEQIRKSLTLEKLKDGGFASNHGCSIPHVNPLKKEAGRSNRNAVYVQLRNGRIIEVPENFSHYVNPHAHKPYAVFMPNLDFIEWALSPSLAIIDYPTVPKEIRVQPYGYISYVRKNGFIDSGLSDSLGFRKGVSIFYNQNAGEIIMTNATDGDVMGKADVQKPEYSDLCQAVSSRFGFQIMLYNPTIVLNLRAAAHLYDQEKLNHFGTQVKAFLSAGGEISSLFAESKKYLQPEPEDCNPLDFNIGAEKIKLSRSESAIVYAMLTARHFEPFTLDMRTLSVTFSSPCEHVLQQLETYRAECTSSAGYQSPAFPRVPALPIGEPQDPSAGYDSDDEFAARGADSAWLCP